MADVRELRVKGVRWLVREDLAEVLLGAAALDPWALARHPSARVVSKESDRVVFTVELPREDDDPLRLTVTIFERPRLRDLVCSSFRHSRAARAWTGAGALESIGIPTPRRVAAGVRRSAGVLRDDCYICETVSGVTSLEDFVTGMLSADAPGARRVFRHGASVLAEFVRSLHDHGVHHLDFGADVVAVQKRGQEPFSGNDLLCEVPFGPAGKGFLTPFPRPPFPKKVPDPFFSLCMVETEGVRRGGALPLGTRLRELRRLNRTFSTAVPRTTRLRFWKAYVDGIPFLEHHWRSYARLLEEQTRAAREAFWRRWDKRCLRTNRDFRRFRVRGVRGCTVRGRIALSDRVLAQIPERGLVMPDAVVWKDSDTTQVWEQRLDFGSEFRTIVVKRKKPRRGVRLLRTFLRRVGALREWQKAHAMKVRGLPVVTMLAAFERRRLGLLLDTYLITEKVEGAESLQRFVERVFGGGERGTGELPCGGEVSAGTARLRRRMARELGRVIRRVHDAGFCHRDLKPDNILVRVGEGGPDDFDFTLIDFEGVWRRRVREWDRARDVARIAAMFVEDDAVRTTDMMHFLDGYLGGYGMSRERRHRFVVDIRRRAWEKRAAWKAKGYLS